MRTQAGIPCSTFWAKLRRHINDARILRNLSAHTNRDTCPKWDDVDEITQLSFGTVDGGSIFECCSVCSDLNIALFGSGYLGMTEAKAMEGTEATICFTRLTSRNGVHGHLENHSCIVKVSPAMAQQFRNAHPEVTFNPQKKFRARLIEYKEQNGELFFSAELLAAV